MLDPTLFEEKPPPSWGSPEWKWGSEDGVAQEVASKIRLQFKKLHRRTSFQAWANSGTVDMSDLTMALALTCERARNLGYDAPDGRWGALMDMIVDAEFDDGGLINQPKLAAAVNERLAVPLGFDEANCALDEYPAAVCGRALKELDFVANGLE